MMENDVQKKLTTLQKKAIPAVVTSATAKEAAELAGCSESSIYKWRLHNPAFKAAVAEYEAMIRDDIRHQLAEKSKDALKVIGGIMTGEITDDGDLRASVRLRAAIAWMDLVIKTQEQTDFERRLTELEARQAANEN